MEEEIFSASKRLPVKIQTLRIVDGERWKLLSIARVAFAHDSRIGLNGIGLMKTLIVDDSITMRKILINALSAAGVTDEVVEACDGQQAVDTVLQDGAIGLVLMDWNMPIMLGIDALKAIRAAGKTVPVIMLTAEAERARVLEAINAGASNFIVRPFKTETLIAKIQEALAKV